MPRYAPAVLVIRPVFELSRGELSNARISRRYVKPTSFASRSQIGTDQEKEWAVNVSHGVSALPVCILWAQTPQSGRPRFGGLGRDPIKFYVPSEHHDSTYSRLSLDRCDCCFATITPDILAHHLLNCLSCRWAAHQGRRRRHGPLRQLRIA
jgi:hypothetical protein